MNEKIEERVLICAPGGKDAALACRVLEAVGFVCHVCNSFAELMEELHRGAGVVLALEEVLPVRAATPLIRFLSAQATWSDLPILVLTSPGGSSPWVKGADDLFGNLTLLERPVRAPTLISAVRSALRARLRQYEIRLSDRSYGFCGLSIKVRRLLLS